jgi:hypothetical protein
MKQDVKPLTFSNSFQMPALSDDILYSYFDSFEMLLDES